MKNLTRLFGLKQGPLIRKKNTWTGMRLRPWKTEFITKKYLDLFYCSFILAAVI
jgi:hypothetical protein